MKHSIIHCKIPTSNIKAYQSDSGGPGEHLDIFTLHNGKILVIDWSGAGLYTDRECWEKGTGQEMFIFFEQKAFHLLTIDGKSHTSVIVGMNYFTEARGFSNNDIKKIQMLDIGGTYSNEDANFIIVSRIPNR